MPITELPEIRQLPLFAGITDRSFDELMRERLANYLLRQQSHADGATSFDLQTENA